jgi:hypothetical protein
MMPGPDPGIISTRMEMAWWIYNAKRGRVALSVAEDGKHGELNIRGTLDSGELQKTIDALVKLRSMLKEASPC